MARKTALIAGAQGLVGRALVRHLEDLGEWDVIGTSRRAPVFETRARFIDVDLTERAQCKAKLAGLGAVTHVFFTAIALAPNEAEKQAINLAMFVNLLDAALPAMANLEHVQLMEGTNWYGNHVGPYPTPAKEDDPRMMPAMFYYPQQDHLEALQKGREWTWSALRPQGVYGFAVGNPMNHLLALATYGAMSAELGLPLRFPGKPGAYSGIYQFTEAALLARAMVWAATTPACANDVFNVTNGDTQRWCNLWPAIADFFGIQAGPVQSVRLAEMMADKEPLWARMVERHGLKDYRIDDLVNWSFADGIYGQDFDHLFNLNKIRKAGWREVVDSQEMLLRHLGDLRRMRVIP